MWFATGAAGRVCVLMVFVVNVCMVVVQGFVTMNVVVAFSDDQQDTDSHEGTGCQLSEAKGFGEYERGEERAGEWRNGKDRGFSRRAEVPSASASR